MRERLRKGSWRLAAGGAAMVVAVVLLVVGLKGLAGGGGGEQDLPPTLRPTPRPTAAPILQVIPTATPTESPSPTAEPTPTPSAAPLVRMVIERLGVDASVMTLGLDKERIPEIPTFLNIPNGHPADWVAWYDFSTLPGWGNNAVFAGHVDWINRLGIFGRLRELKEGDTIQVYLADGTTYRYAVTDNLRVAWDDPEAIKYMLGTEEEMVTLITCGGTWVPERGNPLGGNYSHRTIVRAARVVDDSGTASAR